MTMEQIVAGLILFGALSLFVWIVFRKSSDEDDSDRVQNEDGWLL